MSLRPKLHLIDGSGYIFRAYYAVRPLSSSDGTPTNAVMGFAKMLHKLLKVEQPTHLGIAFDTGEKNFRHQMYPQYKANREAPPEDLVPQFALIHELVTAMGLPPILKVGFEADDILATLADAAVAAGYHVTLVTGDKDLMQLVGEHLTLFDPLKDQFFNAAAVTERFGVGPEHVADILALAGDTSDNVPGVPKVGPKGAAKLVQTFGDVEAVIAGLTQQPKRKAFEESVLVNQEMARLSKRLVLLDHHTPVPFSAEALQYNGPNKDALTAFLQRIEARGLLRDFSLDAHAPPAASQPVAAAAPSKPATDTAFAAPDAAAEAAQQVPPLLREKPDLFLGKLLGKLSPTRPVDRSSYRCILAQSDFDELLQQVRTAGLVSVDLETSSLTALEADIVGISLCVPDGVAAYIPLAHHYLGVPKQLPLAQTLAALTPLLQDEKLIKVGQNLKYDALVLSRYDIALRGIGHDAMLAAYVLDASRTSFGLDSLSRELLQHDPISYDSVTGTGRSRRLFSDIAVEDACQYAAEDADVALRLCQVLVPQLYDAQNPLAANLYNAIEMPLLPVLLSMEQNGVFIDPAQLKVLEREFQKRLTAIETRAFAAIGRPINLGSPKQLSELFFTELKLTPIKKNKTGYSTDQAVLEALALQHELPAIILEHRVLSKLKNTYVDALPRMRNSKTGRVHTSFNQSGTATGRLSSSDPNLQNIPIRSEDGRRIRAAIVAAPGHCIISADYSQIELRIMAHLSEDPSFIDAFVRGEDIHARTAQEILTGGAPPDKEMRRRAKAINFGILYGLSEFGLSKQLNIARAEAHAYITAYFSRYARIRHFLDETIEQGKERGYVATILGRRRPLPNLRSQNGTVRQAAERIAMNAPIQGSAADLIKLAMIRVAARLREQKRESRLLLQVHDELLLEAPLHEREVVQEMVRHEMASVWQLRVPLVVDVGWGDNWALAH